jgi:hypothetical protein
MFITILGFCKSVLIFFFQMPLYMYMDEDLRIYSIQEHNIIANVVYRVYILIFQSVTLDKNLIFKRFIYLKDY